MFTLDNLVDFSFRFKSTRYLNLTEAQVLENEQMWAEEKVEQLHGNPSEALISDLEYFNKKVLRTLAVPAHYLNLELAEPLSSEG